MLLGKTWNLLIVAQVAFAVALLPGTLVGAWQFARFGLVAPRFEAEDYVTATLTMERETPTSAEAESYNRAFARRYGVQRDQLVERLRGEPAVVAATFATSNPREESTAMIEAEGIPLPQDSVDYTLAEGTRRGYSVRSNRVDLGFFDAFEIPIVAGRAFHPSDRDSAATAAIVNRAFIQNILRNQDALGRRFRFVGRGGDSAPEDAPIGPWFEIVGVVDNFLSNDLDAGGFSSRVYLPARQEQFYSTLFVRVRGDAATTFAGRLRQLSAAVDPTLQLREIKTLAEKMGEEQRMMRLGALALVLTTLSVVLLSAAGIYALMSVAVTQRRREIGVRAALGAQPRRILSSIFSRATRQLAIGIVVGLLGAVALDRLTRGELMRGEAAVVLPTVSLLMLTVGLLAAVGPARRGLRIQPTDAVKEL
jgi:hypothetical protein